MNEAIQSGARVIHQLFGIGTVEQISGPKENRHISIKFDKGERKVIAEQFGDLKIAGDNVIDQQRVRPPYKPEQREQAIDLLVKGLSLRKVADQVGLARLTVQKIRDEIRERLPRNCECGRTNGHRGMCAGRVEAAREAARENGRTAYAPKKEFELQKCGCGRDQGHLGMCSYRVEENKKRQAAMPPTFIRELDRVIEKLKVEKSELEKKISSCEECRRLLIAEK